MRNLKISLLIPLLAFMASFRLQEFSRIIPSAPLKGHFQKSARPKFAWPFWFNGKYQEQYEFYFNDTTRFHKELIRLYNQCDYSLFNIPHGAKYIMGKEGYMYSRQWIDNWTGDNFMGVPFIRAKTERLKCLQEKLWAEQHKLLMVIITPDRARIFPEYIPERFVKRKKPDNNHDHFVREMEACGINFIDFTGYFCKMRDSALHPLIAKSGSHWGSYGALIAADSTLKYIRAKFGKNVPEIIIGRIDYSTSPRNDDDDITRTMNLIRKIKLDPMPYPVFHTCKTDETFIPRVLFISDSFYKIWEKMGIIDSVFANDDFWYYHEEVFPPRDKQHSNAWNLSLTEEIAKQDVIVIMETSGGSPYLGHGFIERLYADICSGPDRVKHFREQILNNPAWKESVRNKAEKCGLTFDAMLIRDAIYLSNRELEKWKKKK